MINPFAHLRQDYDGHWYCVPKSLCRAFDSKLSQICDAETIGEPVEIIWQIEDEFNEMFFKYRIFSPYEVTCILPECESEEITR